MSSLIFGQLDPTCRQSLFSGATGLGVHHCSDFRRHRFSSRSRPDSSACRCSSRTMRSLVRTSCSSTTQRLLPARSARAPPRKWQRDAVGREEQGSIHVRCVILILCSCHYKVSTLDPYRPNESPSNKGSLTWSLQWKPANIDMLIIVGPHGPSWVFMGPRGAS